MSSAPDARAREIWVGLGRADITACVEGMSMFGWGSSANIPNGVAMPLTARALVLAETRESPPLVLCTVELAMVSQALRRASLQRLRELGIAIDEDRFAIVANHTHSGPAGYSTFMWYAMAGPGFSPALVRRLASGVAEAVRAGLASLAPGRVRLAEGDIPLSEPVAWNRSLVAYNRNLDVAPLPVGREDEAVSRRMTVLRFESSTGEPRGLFAVFAVHGTSIHADNDKLHPDNSGVAAAEVERQMEERGRAGFVALFAPGAAGDVSPNYRYSAWRRKTIGRYEDDFESAHWHGCIQAREALRLLAVAGSSPALPSTLRGVLADRALRDVTIDDRLLPRDASCDRAASPCLGFGFALGTREGPGPFARAPGLLAPFKRLARASSKRGPHHPKQVMVNLAAGVDRRVAAAIRFEQAAHLWRGDRRPRYYLAVRDSPAVQQLPWVPEVLPFQILCIGDFALTLLPFEPTTVAGRRLAGTLERALPSLRAGSSLVLGYANAYAGYLTTAEEYDVQAYEGASTLFGRNSLAAVGTVVRCLAAELLVERRTPRLSSTYDFDLAHCLPSVDDFAGGHAAGLAWAVLPDSLAAEPFGFAGRERAQLR